MLIDFLKREFAAVSSFCLSIVQVWAEETLIVTTVGKNLDPVKFATISACVSDKVLSFSQNFFNELLIVPEWVIFMDTSFLVLPKS